MSRLRSVVCMLVNILAGLFFVRVGFKSNFHNLNMRLLIIKYKGGKSISKGSHINDVIMVPDMISA